MKFTPFIFLLLATVPCIVTGCGSSNTSITSNVGQTKDGGEITLGDNTLDLGNLPFYLIGNQILKAKDVDVINSDYSGKPAYADFSSTTTNVKPFGSYTLSLLGSNEFGPNFTYYQLTIDGGLTSAALNNYVVGVVRDINGTVLTFNAVQVLAGLPAIFQPLQSNKIEVYSWQTDVAGASNGKSYLDYSINVPTAAANDFAPYTGQAGTSRLVLSNTSTDYNLVRNEFDWNSATATLSRVSGSSATNVALPWRPVTKSATSSTATTINKATREIKFTSTFPAVYWKAGYGIIESLGQIRDDKLFILTTDIVLKADGSYVSPTTPAPVAGVTTNNHVISTTYVDYNVNTAFSKVSGFYLESAVIPHAAN